MSKVIECTKTVYIIGETSESLHSSNFTITVENNDDTIYIMNRLYSGMIVNRKDIKELYEALTEIDNLPYTKV